MNDFDWPKIYWKDGDKWVFTFVENGKAREGTISKRNAAILMKSIADAFERDNRDTKLVEWQQRVAV